MTLIEHALYALAWLSFGLGHSLLAGARGRRWLGPRVGRWHRLAYNAIATVHIALVIGVGRAVFAGDVAPFARPLWLELLQGAALLAALALFVAGGRRYDLARLLGTRPEREDGPPEPLVTTGLHAHLRHPLYAGAHLFFLGAATDPFRLATALWAALYLAVGTMFEERRLLAVHGASYADYRRHVPALIPRLRPYRPRRAGAGAPTSSHRR